MTPLTVLQPGRLAGSSLLKVQSDERLVELVRIGNDRAFEAAVERYRKPLLRYCSTILPPGRAEDAVQQTFLNAYRAMKDGSAELNLRPWLYRIGHNCALSALRQGGWDHEQIHEDVDGVERPDQAFDRRERLRSVVASVKDLPDRQRDAMILRELEGRSYSEIAAHLGLTGGAVRQLLNRARNTLRAGVTVLTPAELLLRLLPPSGQPMGPRVAELSAGAGAGFGAVLLKAGATVLVTGAVVTGGVETPLPTSGDHDRDTSAQAAPQRGGGSAASTGSDAEARTTASADLHGGPTSGAGVVAAEDTGERPIGRDEDRGERAGEDRDGDGERSSRGDDAHEEGDEPGEEDRPESFPPSDDDVDDEPAHDDDTPVALEEHEDRSGSDSADGADPARVDEPAERREDDDRSGPSGDSGDEPDD